MPQLDPSTYSSQIFWLLVCFGVLCFTMAKFLAPKIGRAIQERTQKIQDELAEAAQLKKETEKYIQLSADKLLKARGEASQILRQTSHELSREKHDKLTIFEKELADRAQASRKKLQAARVEVEESIPTMVSDVIKSVAPKFFPGDLKAGDIKKLVDSVLIERVAK